MKKDKFESECHDKDLNYLDQPKVIFFLIFQSVYEEIKKFNRMVKDQKALMGRLNS